MSNVKVERLTRRTSGSLNYQEIKNMFVSEILEIIQESNAAQNKVVTYMKDILDGETHISITR